jgi:hypothetical protein
MTRSIGSSWNADWRLGQSLDALDDLLYGGFGAIEGGKPVILVWRDMERSRAALGTDATIASYRAKLARPDIYDRSAVERKIADLECGKGATYFDVVAEIIAGHANISLRPE